MVYSLPEPLLGLALLALLVLASELGFRAGRQRGPTSSDAVRQQVGNIQTALLALFALLLAFTFSMALSRFDQRRQLVVREANAIGTATLRARLLPPPQRVEAAGLFRRYVEVRLEAARGANLPTPRHQVLDDEAGLIQERLWRSAVAAAEADPRSVPAGLFTQAMNELIDLKGERDAALANHVPESVLALIFAFAVLAMGVVGYENGYAGARTLGVTTLLCALTALVILVIVDLDRPRRGLIRISQESMVSLQKNLEAPER
jgi:hypothetical protein